MEYFLNIWMGISWDIIGDHGSLESPGPRGPRFLFGHPAEIKFRPGNCGRWRFWPKRHSGCYTSNIGAKLLFQTWKKRWKKVAVLHVMIYTRTKKYHIFSWFAQLSRSLSSKSSRTNTHTHKPFGMVIAELKPTYLDNKYSRKGFLEASCYQPTYHWTGIAHVALTSRWQFHRRARNFGESPEALDQHSWMWGFPKIVVPLNYPFSWDFPLKKPSSYVGTPHGHGNTQQCEPGHTSSSRPFIPSSATQRRTCRKRMELDSFWGGS